MAALARCPSCDRELPPDSPAGLCPECLLREGFERPAAGESPLPVNPLGATTPQPPSFVPPAVAELAPRFPQLEIIALLGHGGMGAVYKARQKKLDRLVALKIIRPESADDPAFAERFTREARTLARLNHPQIVAIHDFGDVETRGERGTAAPLYYFIMEYVDGVNLRQMLGGQHLSADEALAVIPQLCDALQYAHDEGVIHRDVKPENILIDARGRVKIADFGLAKIAVGSADDYTLTQTHQVMGTPRYMAPEQMTGSRSVDHRADLYSLGVVFYEMLTGELPLGKFEPPSSKTPLDLRLDEVVLRALDSDPDRRFQQASELRSSLEALRGTATESAAAWDASSTPASRGVSTIFEQGVARAMRRVSPYSIVRLLQHPATPGACATLLSVAGAATMFVSWAFRSEVTDTSQTVGRLYGFDNIYSGLCGVLFFVLTLGNLMDSGAPSSAKTRGAFSIVLGAVILGLVWAYQATVAIQFEIVQLEGGFIAAFGLAVAVMLAGAWDVRRGFARDAARKAAQIPPASRLAARVAAQQPAPDRAAPRFGPASPQSRGGALAPTASDARIAVPQPGDTDSATTPSGSSEAAECPLDDLELRAEIDGPSLGLIVVGLLTAVGHGIAVIVGLSDRGHDGRETAFFAAPGLLIGIAMIVGGVNLRRLWSHAWAQLGAWAGVIPLTPGWLLSIGMAIWANGVLSRPHVRRAFIDQARFRARREAARTEPRFSRKAILGACWAPFVLGVPLAVVTLLESGHPQRLEWWQVLFTFTIGPLGAAAPFATTTLGLFALGEIRRSQGKLIGLRLALADALILPLLLLFGVVVGVPLMLGGLIWIVLGALLVAAPLTWIIVGWAWRAASAPLDSEHAPAATKSALSRQARPASRRPPRGGRDWVALTRERIERDNLPDVCMVCGSETRERLNRTFSHQPEWAQVLTLFGIMLGVIPGLIVDALTSRNLRVACPICAQHRNHWSRLVWVASLGWLVPVLLGVVGALIARAIGFGTGLSSDVTVAAQIGGGAIGVVVGLIAYLAAVIYLASTRITVESMTNDELRLRRVAGAFARAVDGKPDPDEFADKRTAPPQSETPNDSYETGAGSGRR